MIRIACDFDGTIVEKGIPLKLKPGADEALRFIKNAGHHLTLYSARSTPDPGPTTPGEVERFYQLGEVPPRVANQWDYFEEMRVFLISAGLWNLFDDVWQAPGKPHADVFIDDRAEEPNWPALAQEFGVQLSHV